MGEMQWIRTNRRNSGKSEHELLQLYKNSGDLEWLGQLYEPYLELVFGVCLKYLQSEEIAQDAVMQIFEQLIQKLRRHEVENFKPWLHTVSRNHCLQLIRRQKSSRLNIEPDFMQSEELLHHDNEFDYVDDYKALHACIENLPERQKQAIELFYINTKSYNEISEIIGEPKEKVRSYLQNGRRNLRLCMERKNENRE
jgi:RNA polymerase sigma-70 factor (ECF subfamily)